MRIALLGLLVWLLATSWRPERLFLSVFECGVCMLVCVRVTRFGLAIPKHPAILAMLALPCFGAVQLASGSSAYWWRTALATLDWSVLAATGWLSYQVFNRSDSPRRVHTAVVAIGLAASVLSLVNWYGSPGQILWLSPNPYTVRAPFPLLNHSHFAALVELALAPAIFEGMRTAGGWRFHSWAAAVMVGAVWAVGSRSGAAIAAVELLGVILLTSRLAPAKIFTRRRALVVAAPAAVLIAGIGWQGLAERSAEEPRDELRPAFLASTLEMIKARPLTGFGLGTWDTVYPAYARMDPGLFVEHAHNDWLEWAAEGGIPFAGVMLGLALFALWRAPRQPWCLGVVAVFMQCAIEFPLHKPAIIALQFAALGFLAQSRGGGEVEITKY